MRKWGQRVLTGLLALYLVYGLVMVGTHRRYIYPFARDVFDDPRFHQVMIPVPGADPVPAAVYLSPDPDAAVILYFMGNVGNLGAFKPAFDLHIAAGRSVIALEYRGGGGVPGHPREADLKADALALYDWSVAQGSAGQGLKGPLVAHGFSLGTGLALHVAANRPVAAVVLDAPYARICDLMARASWLPACLLPFVDHWSNVAYAGRVSAPILIQHGDADQTIPLAQAKQLAARLTQAGRAVTMFTLGGTGHASLIDHPDYAGHLAAFIQALPPSGGS